MNFLKSIISFGLILISTSCKNLLEYEPNDQVTLDKYLQDKTGFISILSGIYRQMGNSSLYGKELEFGLLDVIAGYWDIHNSHKYYPIYQLNYKSSESQKKIFAIWSELYGLIRQCNQLLHYIEQIRNDPDYSIIKGEILALRAFFHFELLRIFGPVISNDGLNKLSIPYYRDISIVKQEKQSSKKILEIIGEDLIKAMGLLSMDPIVNQGRKNNLKISNGKLDFLKDNRGLHLNLYAVIALNARKLNWERKTLEAAEEALKLINLMKNHNTIKLVNPDKLFELNQKIDIRITSENIFGLYNNRMKEMLDGSFSGNTFFNTFLSPAYYPMLEQLYGQYKYNDIRFRLWGPNDSFQKFYDRNEFDPATEIDPIIYNETQIINISELYFIVVEGYLDSDIKKSLRFLNEFRISRNIPQIRWTPDLTVMKMRSLLLDEIRKEYIGEGMLFFYYKNFNHKIFRNDFDVKASSDVFVLPIPEEEKIY